MKVNHFCCATACVAFAIGLSQPARADSACKFAQIASLPVIMDGYTPTVAVKVNGKEAKFGLSSGAFFNEMSLAKAAELGLVTEDLPVSFTVSGVGGSFTPRLARVRDFQIAGIILHDVNFIVGGNDYGIGYLGANLLGVYDTEFDFANGAVKLFKASGCNRLGLAYWGKGMSVGEARLLAPARNNDQHIYVEVIVNGHPLRAVLSTNTVTEIGSAVAARIGIDLNSPDVVSAGSEGGVSARKLQSWVARSVTVSVGGEQIRNTPIRLIDDHLANLTWDMTLGIDFLMAHHVLVAQSQRKMFLTYNGGPIFAAGTEQQFGRVSTISEKIGRAENAAEPKTADEFAGRGSARLTRGDTIGAIADFSEALRLAPTRTDLLADRATAYSRGDHPELAAKDIDAALAINPADHRLLTSRAQMRLSKDDKVGALADTDAAATAAPKGSLDIRPIVTLYERLGLADRGLALLDRVIELHEDDNNYPGLLNKRSWNRALANSDLDRALRDINTALRKSEDAPAMLDTRALVQFRRKDYAAAIADASAALAKTPKRAASLFARGLAKQASGDAAGAQADFAAARAINPTIDQTYELYGMTALKASAPVAAPVPHGNAHAG